MSWGWSINIKDINLLITMKQPLDKISEKICQKRLVQVVPFQEYLLAKSKLIRRTTHFDEKEEHLKSNSIEHNFQWSPQGQDIKSTCLINEFHTQINERWKAEN